MPTRRFIALLSLALGSFAAITVVAQTQQSDDTQIIEQPVDRDLYVAHREVDVRSTVNGDLVTAGRRVTVGGDVVGDIIAAAQSIEIRSEVGDDIRAAGQHVRVTSPVAGHIVAAGQTVTIEQSVGDWAWLAGSTVEVLGNVGGAVSIRASKITINAEIAGDVDLVGEELDLGPKAVIRGDLKWRSDNEADISPDARIDGELTREPLPGLLEELNTGDTYTLPLNLIAAVMVLFLLFSRPLRASTDRIQTRASRALLIGFVVFAATPLLGVLLLFSGVGVWLGLALLITFLVVLLLGVLTGLFAASDMVLRRFSPQPPVWQSLAAIFVTVVAVGLLAKVPWLGFILVLAILLTGIGALCWNAWATLRSYGHAEPQPSY